MVSFTSIVTSKIDNKGRVSLPAGFRDVIKLQNGDLVASSVYLFQALQGHPALEGGGTQLYKSIEQHFDRLDWFDARYEILALKAFSHANYLTVDGDGRITIPRNLLDFAKINDTLCFVGMGRKFQIWNPEYFTQFCETQTHSAKDYLDLLHISPPINEAKEEAEAQ